MSERGTGTTSTSGGSATSSSIASSSTDDSILSNEKLTVLEQILLQLKIITAHWENASSDVITEQDIK